MARTNLADFSAQELAAELRKRGGVEKATDRELAYELGLRMLAYDSDLMNMRVSSDNGRDEIDLEHMTLEFDQQGAICDIMGF